MGEDGIEAEVGLVEEGGKLREAESEAFGRGGAEGDVTQLSARTRGFAVEMEVRIGNGEDLR